MAAYVLPVIGGLSVAAIDTTLVLKVLEPIWATKTQTATRVRGRIDAILNWAATRGYRQASIRLVPRVIDYRSRQRG